MAVQSHYNASLHTRPITWTRAFALEMAYAYLWAAVTPPVLWLARRFPRTRAGVWRHGLLHLAAAVLLSLAVKAAWDLICLEPDKRWKAIAVAVDYGVLEYALILLSVYFRQYHQRSAQLEAQLVHAQLAALRMQLQPHFLFNTLHAISELIHQNPGAAERMIVRLSEFFRLTLDTSAAAPNFLLQSLVENAIRHGLAHCLEGGLLRIETRCVDGRLHLKVADNGPGPPCKQIRPGYGLGITQQRLERLYGGHHRLGWKSPASGGCEVEIEIPWKRFGPDCR